MVQGWHATLECVIVERRAENPQFGANSVHVSLKVAELQLLEVDLGLNAIFQILVKNRENINFY